MNKRPKQERTKLGSVGGKASGKARKKQKLQREILAEILSLTANKKAVSQLADILGSNKKFTNEEVILAGVVQKAMDGSLAAAGFIRDTLGQSPTNKTDLTTDGNPICAAIVPNRATLESWENDKK